MLALQVHVRRSYASPVKPITNLPAEGRLLCTRGLPVVGRCFSFASSCFFLGIAGAILFMCFSQQFSISAFLLSVGFGFFGLLTLLAAVSRGEVRWYPDSREIVFIRRCPGFSPSVEHFSTSDVTSLRQRRHKMLSGMKHDLYFVTHSGEERFLCSLSHNEMETIPHLIAETLGFTESAGWS